jgi:two-component system sensor histidine kinase/response regulator
MVVSLEVKKVIEQDAAAELAFTSDQVTLKIQDRLDAYALILKGGASLFAASNAVDRRAWQAYVEKLRSQDSVPGVQGIGFSQVIPPQQLAAHIASIRAEGFPDYSVRPAGERALYTSIIYLEPFRDRNLRAFGFDMFSEPVRRAAMEQARDSGAPALSGKVELVQETGTEVQAGTLMYVPVYGNGAPTDTVEQRRAALIGWTYSPYRLKDLMGGILDNWADHKTKRVHLQIYAGTEVQADSLLYDSHPVIHKIDPRYYQQRTIDFNGQHWLLAFHVGEVVAISYANAWAALAGGILLSSLLCALMLALARTQVRAREIADSLTEDLRRSGDSLRESEAALQSFTRDFDAFLDQTSDFVYFKDADSRIRFCSKALADITGHRHWRDMVGKHDRELFPPDTAKIYEEEEAPVFAEGRPLLNKVDPYYDKDGRTGYVETNKWPLFDDDKTVVGIFGISRDITERKRVEAELDRHRHHLEELLTERTADLRAAETKYRIIADFTYDWETWVDAAGHWVYCSPACERVTGYRAEEFLARPALFLEITHDDDRADLLERLTEVEGNGVRDLEFRIHHKNGQLRWIEHMCQPVRNEAGKSLGRRFSNRDITERKRSEEALRQARDQAEAANRAKSAFLANMSHELRTPMNGVLGMINLAKRRMADAKGLDQLDKAELSANRLLGLLNDILDISKIEAERMIFENIPLQLSAVVENLTSTLGHKVTEKGLRLAADLPADLMRQPLKGDPLRLGQILFNLVGNAIKFTEQGSVTLRARAVGETPEAVQVRFEVVDTGIGIEPEAQTRLFRSFEQADNSMTRKYGGTGLGLAICKRLVQLMGGAIGAVSTPGQGSTFWFVVPLKKREADAIPPVTEGNPLFGTPTFTALTAEQRLQADYAGTRILLAEDEPINQEVSRHLLEDVGLIVDLAEDGQQALELAKQNTYALILMDMQMPHLNGVEATQSIRADSLNKTTPILAMTANAFDEDRQVCIDAGMNEHIAKPVDPDRLYETLLAWLEKHSS